MAERKSPLLPWEIIICIVEFVPTLDLYPLLLTCKTTHEVAERYLYRHINLHNCPRRSIHFYSTILERPELGRYVLTLETSENFNYSEGKLAKAIRRIRRKIVDHSYEAEYLIFGEIVMERLKNIQSISVQAMTSNFADKLVDLTALKRFRLRQTAVIADYGALFDNLTNVTHLELPFSILSTSSEGVRDEHLPNIEELVCITDIAMKVVPNKPVRKLFMMFPFQWQAPPSPYDLMLRISRSTAKITVLGLTVRWVWQGEMPHLLHATGIFLPDVEELYLAWSFFRGHVAALRQVLASLPVDLEAFKSLHLIDFRRSFSCGVPYFDAHKLGLSNMYTSVLKTWSQHCPTLSKVIFPNGTTWTRNERGTWSSKNLLLREKDATSEFRHQRRLWHEEPMFQKDLTREWPEALKWADV